MNEKQKKPKKESLTVKLRPDTLEYLLTYGRKRGPFIERLIDQERTKK